jgi:ribosomal protein L11 methyltransferase
VVGAGFPTVRLRMAGDAAEDLATVLVRFPVLGTQFDDAAGGEVEVTVYLEPGADERLPDLVADLGAIVVADPLVSRIPAADWLQRYRESCRPFVVGTTWWIDPDPVHPTPAPDGRRRIVLEPRFAFGSGSHETTQLLLRHLEDQSLTGARVLDVGTGSGILAFAALHCGAASVVAFDIDPEAVAIAGAAARIQALPMPTLFAGPLEALAAEARFDLVLCNMIAAEFLPMLGDLGTRLGPGGRLLLSGILADQTPWVMDALRAVGLSARPGLTAAEWVSLECTADGP